MNLDNVLLVVRAQLKKGTVATFHDACGVFGSGNYSFSTFPSRLKVIQLFKAKKVTFRDKKSKKVENDKTFLHLAFVLSVEMKTVFSVLEPETLRKPMV